MINELVSIKVDKIAVEEFYIDFSEQINNSISTNVCTKVTNLSKAEKDTNFKKIIADYLNENIKEHPMFGIFQIDHLDDLEKRIAMRIQIINNYIATDGRIGPATHTILNTKTNLRYGKHIYGKGLNIVINDYIDDDVFYIVRSTKESPGYKFYYCELGNDLYFDIAKIGSAEKQAYKFVLNSNRKKRKIKLDKIKSKHDQKLLD
jgi:hypothetical protein